MNTFRCLILIVSMLSSFYVYSDIIIMKNGESIHCEDIDIAKDNVYYKNNKGKIIKIPSKTVFGIKIGSGEVQKIEEFLEESVSQNTNIATSYSSSGISFANPHHDNSKVINKYNKDILIREDEICKNKKTQSGYILWGIAPQSIMKSSEVEVSFKFWESPNWIALKNYYYFYKIEIANTSNSVIYIDLVNVFRSFKGGADDGLSEPWFDSTTFSQSSESGPGISFGLGALTNMFGIGGFIGNLAHGTSMSYGTSKSSGMMKQMNRILSVPPMSKVSLPPNYVLNGKNIKECYTLLTRLYKKSEISMSEWGQEAFDVNSAPFGMTIYINYALDSSFKDVKWLKIDLFSKNIYGTPDPLYFFPFDKNKEKFMENNSDVIISPLLLYKEGALRYDRLP